MLGRKVALAVIKQTSECSPSPTVQEWQALAQTGNNDNIVTLYDRGTSDGIDYMVFVYLAGGTLRDQLRKRAEKGTPFSSRRDHEAGQAGGQGSVPCAQEWAYSPRHCPGEHMA